MNTKINPDSKNSRLFRVIRNSIDILGLDLSGYTVLTEAGSGNYAYLPVIAALAGAEKVFAWTADSPYGQGEAIKSNSLKIASEAGAAGKIEIAVNNQPCEHIEKADIITNSGFLRPLDASRLAYAKKQAVIPLMYEKWEFREGEIDLEYCRAKGIRVAGTWENHPLIKVFDYVGMLGAKMAFEAGYEIFQNRIAIWSNDDFGETIAETFRNLGASMVVLTDSIEELTSHGSFDFIFICDYDEDREILGPNGFLQTEMLKQASAGVVHLYGIVDAEYLEENGIHVYPGKNGWASRMSFTLGHVGIEPIIRLQTAGLKVAQGLLCNKQTDLIQRIC